MNFEEVLACLENQEKCKEFILRLQAAGENSEPALHLKSAMTELKMNCTPRGVDEKSTMQHMFKYADSEECFLSFRLVCKAWKDAIETIRFDQIVPRKTFSDINGFVENELPIPSYFPKYIRCFKKLAMPWETNQQLESLLLVNMKNLNALHFKGNVAEDFRTQMLSKHHHTLIEISATGCILPNISFPEVTKLNLHSVFKLGDLEFQRRFSMALQNMNSLKNVRILTDGGVYNEVTKYIADRYGKHCISQLQDPYAENEDLNWLPVKILTNVVDLMASLYYVEYVESLMYLTVLIPYPKRPMLCGWEKFQEIFDQCVNLRAIAFTWGDYDSRSPTMPELSLVNENIWNKRMEYFKKRGIQIVDTNEIEDNENLRMKIMKEAGITWDLRYMPCD